MPPVFPVAADCSFVSDGEAQVAGAADTLYFLSRNARGEIVRVPINA